MFSRFVREFWIRQALACVFVALAGLNDAGAMPAKPEIYQVDEGGYEGRFAVRVAVEPHLAYDLAWSLSLRDESWHSTGIQWESLNDEIGIVGPRSTPIFFRVNYHNAFAPRVVGDELAELFIAALDGDIDIESRSENQLSFSSTQTEDGLRITLFGTIRYQRTYLNDAEIVAEIRSARVRDIASGDSLTFTIPELAQLSGEVIPEKLVGAVTFTSPMNGWIDLRTVYTDNSEGDFETVEF